MKASDMDIVDRIVCTLTSEVGAERFELWFGQGVQFSVRDACLVVAAASRFSLHGLQKYLHVELNRVAQATLGNEAQVAFQLDPTLVRFGYVEPPAEPEEPVVPSTPTEKFLFGAVAQATTAAVDRRSPPPPLDHRFETFVVGEANRVAYAAAQMVCESPGSVSPLLLHGLPGSGKTHLTQALCGAIRRKRVSGRVVHVSAEHFTSDFVDAIRGAGLPGFRRKYRDVSVLAIDDAQFFAGKKATLGELASTIDAFGRSGKQLVFTADRPAAALGMLGAEISARLGGGLVCEMLFPEGSTRTEIVQAFAHRLNLEVPGDVCEFIAERVAGDVRRLHGALHRLNAVQRVSSRELDLEFVRTALADLLSDGARTPLLNDVERVVCDSFRIEPADLRSESRTQKFVVPRMLAMWLARKHTGAALAEISRHFGRRSHSTVLSAEEKVNAWLASEASLRMHDRDCAAREAVRRLESRLRLG